MPPEKCHCARSSGILTKKYEVSNQLISPYKNSSSFKPEFQLPLLCVIIQGVRKAWFVH